MIKSLAASDSALAFSISAHRRVYSCLDVFPRVSERSVTARQA